MNKTISISIVILILTLNSCTKEEIKNDNAEGDNSIEQTETATGEQVLASQEEIMQTPELTQEVAKETVEQNSEINDYIGLSISDAEKFAQKRGEIFIINIVDGENNYMLTDFEEGRIRAAIEDGIVVSYFVEGETTTSESTSQLIETDQEIGPEVILTGDFSGDTSGSIEIVRDGDQNTLVFSGFSTGTAPDLRVYVSENTINSKSDISGATEIAELKAKNGDQTYILPANIDADNIVSIAIHCKSYNKLYGTASVR